MKHRCSRRSTIPTSQAAAALKHPNIAVIHKIDEIDGVDFIAMELIEGEKLSDVLERGGLSTQRAIKNIVTIHEIGEHEGTPYIAMEYVDGKTLREMLAQGPPPTKKLLQLATQVAEGLAKAPLVVPSVMR